MSTSTTRAQEVNPQSTGPKSQQKLPVDGALRLSPNSETISSTPAEIAVSNRGLTSETRYRKEAAMKPTHAPPSVESVINTPEWVCA